MYREARKLKLTLKTDACLRPCVTGKHRAPHMRRGTCGIVGGFAKSQTGGRQARQGRPSPRRSWRPPGSPRLRRAAELGHRRRASGPSCSTSVAAFVLKTRLRSRPLKTPRGHRAAPGCPRGLSQDPGGPSPNLGAGGGPAKTPSDIGRFSGKWRKPGTRPRRARPAHTLLYEPPRPGTRARSPPPDPLFQTPRTPIHPRSLRRRTCIGRGPTTSRRCSATA